MLSQNIVNKHIVLIAVFGFQISRLRYRPVSCCHILKMRKDLSVAERSFFQTSHRSGVICQIIVDNKFIQRRSIVRYLRQICNCGKCLPYMRIFCDHKLCVRIVYLCTCSIQISTNCTLRLNNRYLCRRSSHINSVIRFFDTGYIFILIISFGVLKLHALHILFAEVEIVGIVSDLGLIYLLSFLFNINNVSVFIINLISVLISFGNKTAASGIIVSVLVTFSKNTVVCDCKLTVGVTVGNIYL